MSFEAVGLPGLVDGWVQGYFPPPPLPDYPDTATYVPILERSRKTTVVGVSPVPPGITTSGLVTRLDSLGARSCGGDVIWAVEMDGDDVPVIKRYRVRWGG